MSVGLECKVNSTKPGWYIALLCDTHILTVASSLACLGLLVRAALEWQEDY